MALRGFSQNCQHLNQALVVRVDERVIEHEGGGAAGRGKDIPVGEPDEHRDLLAGAGREALARFGAATAVDAGETEIAREGERRGIEQA